MSGNAITSSFYRTIVPKRLVNLHTLVVRSDPTDIDDDVGTSVVQSVTMAIRQDRQGLIAAARAIVEAEAAIKARAGSLNTRSLCSEVTRLACRGL